MGESISDLPTSFLSYNKVSIFTFVKHNILIIYEYIYVNASSKM